MQYMHFHTLARVEPMHVMDLCIQLRLLVPCTEGAWQDAERYPVWNIELFCVSRFSIRYKVKEEKARLLREQAHTEEARMLQEQELKKMEEAREAAAAERKKVMAEALARQEELDKQRQAAQEEHQKQLQGEWGVT